MRMILLVFVRCIVAYDKNADEIRNSSESDGIAVDAFHVYATPNEPAILSCNIISKHLPNVTWIKERRLDEQKNVNNSAINFRWINKPHGITELQFTSVTPEDYANYKCQAQIFNRIHTERVQLQNYPPELNWTVEVLKQESIFANWKFGHDILYRGSSFGIEYRKKDTDQWLQTLPHSTPERIVDAGSFVINALEPNTVYEVKGIISLSLSQSYRTYVFSKWVATSVSAKVIPEADVVYIELNERAALSCDVMGEQITEFTWPEVPNSSKRYFSNVHRNSKTHFTMELEFANFTHDDPKKYRCQAKSSDELVSATYELEVQNFDFVPLKVRAIGTDRICIIWNYTNIPRYYDNTYVKITTKYKENGTNQWHQAGQIFNSTIDPATGHYIIRELKNRTLYQIKNIGEFRARQSHHVLQTWVHSKWATTFEKDVEYVPTLEIVNKTMDAITIKWSQPPPELRENIDAYLISVETGNAEEKHFRWQKYKTADRDKAVVYLSPSISYDLVVRACFGDDCPDRHASVAMRVMTNDTAGREHLRARGESESDTQFSALTMSVTRDAENIGAGRNTSFTCSVKVQGYEGWWTKERGRVTFIKNSDGEIDWTIIVGDTEEGNTRDYTCVAKITEDSHTYGTMLVMVIPPTDDLNVESETVYVKLHESTALVCDFFGYQLSNFKWHQVPYLNYELTEGVGELFLNKTHIRKMLYFANTSDSYPGMYQCEATNSRLKKVIGSVKLEVSDQSPLQLSAITITSRLVSLRWTDRRFRGDTHLIRSSENGSLEWHDTLSVPVFGGKKYNGYVVKQLSRGTSYWFELVVISAGKRLASTYSRWITSTEKDLLYFPNITVTLRTANSITIDWLTPPVELRAHITVYHVLVNYTYNESKVVDLKNTTDTYFSVAKLQSSTSHDLEVRACFSEVSTDCYSRDVQRGVFTKSIDEDFGTQVKIWVPLTGIFVLIVLGAWNFYSKAKKRKLMRQRLAYFYSDKPVFFNAELAISDQANLLPYEKKWEFPRKLLRLDKELGSGSFGIVWKARAKTIRRPEAISVVAVKTVRTTASLRCMRALYRELKILIYLGHHPNIVSILGACTKNLDYGELLVIVEFCRFGNLHDYLWRCRSKFVDELHTDSQEIPNSNSDADSIRSTNSALHREAASSVVKNSCDSCDQPGTSKRADNAVTDRNSQLPEIKPPFKYPGDFTNADLDPVRTQDLVSWAWQISRGMQYLAAKKVLHGDLAARNVLLSEDNIIKICDFGLSKPLQENDDYKGEGNDPLPVKWMAIESLRDGVFSVKSDVWSFGIVLWELFSLAKTPYPEINPENMCETLVGGYRMERPKYSSRAIYDTMLQCWDANPSKRPSFVDLERSIGDLMEESVRMHYIELYTRCARMYTEITENRTTQVLENQDPIPLVLTERTSISQDEKTEQSPFRMRFKKFLHRGE